MMLTRDFVIHTEYFGCFPGKYVFDEDGEFTAWIYGNPGFLVRAMSLRDCEFGINRLIDIKWDQAVNQLLHKSY